MSIYKKTLQGAFNTSLLVIVVWCLQLSQNKSSFNHSELSPCCHTGTFYLCMVKDFVGFHYHPIHLLVLLNINVIWMHSSCSSEFLFTFSSVLTSDSTVYLYSLHHSTLVVQCTVCVCVCVCVCVFIGVCPAVSSPVTVGGSCGGCSGYGRGLSVAIGGGSSSSSSRVASLETHTQAHTHTHTHTKELTRTAVRKETPGLRCRQRWNILTFYSKERLIFMTSLQNGLYLVTSEEILLILQDDYFIFSVILEVIF